MFLGQFSVQGVKNDLMTSFIVYRVSHKFVLTFQMQIKYGTFRSEPYIYCSMHSSFNADHLDSRCSMLSTLFCSVGGLMFACANFSSVISSFMLEQGSASASCALMIIQLFLTGNGQLSCLNK